MGLSLDKSTVKPGEKGIQQTAARDARPTLKRTLGVNDAVMLILSSVVGVGIFLTPREIAVQVDNPYWFLILWMVGGLIALSGAMSSAALGTMLPRAGGDYAFLRSAYGPGWGFLYGYLCFVITFTGSIAAYATGVMQYQGRTISIFLFGTPVLSEKLLEIDIFGLIYTLKGEQLAAAGLVFFFTMINHFGTKKSLRMQRYITMGPIIVLCFTGLLIIAKLFFSEQSDPSRTLLGDNFSSYDLGSIPPMGAMAMAMIPIFFTYTGWNAALYLGEDIKTPRKIIPKALLIGIAIVAVIYFLFCTVLLSTVPYSVLHDSSRNIDVASRAWGSLFGGNSGAIMAVLIAVLIMGSLNSSIITGSRIFFAMGRDGIFFSQAGHIHPRHHTPSWSLWAQATWTCGIILFVGKFQTILEYTTVVITFMSILTIASLFLLRYRMVKNARRARIIRERQRLLGFPIAPLFYVVSTSLILLGVAVYKGGNIEKFLLIGCAFGVCGYIIYRIWARISRTES